MSTQQCGRPNEPVNTLRAAMLRIDQVLIHRLSFTVEGLTKLEPLKRWALHQSRLCGWHIHLTIWILKHREDFAFLRAVCPEGGVVARSMGSLKLKEFIPLILLSMFYGSLLINWCECVQSWLSGLMMLKAESSQWKHLIRCWSGGKIKGSTRNWPLHDLTSGFCDYCGTKLLNL